MLTHEHSCFVAQQMQQAHMHQDIESLHSLSDDLNHIAGVQTYTLVYICSEVPKQMRRCKICIIFI